jgi:hypothetical protein
MNHRDDRPKLLPVVASLPPNAKNDLVAPNAATGTQISVDLAGGRNLQEFEETTEAEGGTQ